MFVKPADGRAPRDPRTMLRVPQEGQHASEFDAAWQFLLLHGDVVQADEPASTEPYGTMAVEDPAAAGERRLALPAPHDEEHA